MAGRAATRTASALAECARIAEADKAGDARATLGVAPAAKPDELKARLRQLRLLLHPDKHPTADEGTKAKLSTALVTATRCYSEAAGAAAEPPAREEPAMGREEFDRTVEQLIEHMLHATQRFGR